MSAIVRKALSLALALALCFTFVGCAEKGEALTQEEIDQIMADSINATATAETYQFDMDMSMTIDVTGGEEAVTMSMTANGTGALNNTSQEMQMIMNGTMIMGIPGQATMEMSMNMEYYIVDRWAYIKVSMPGMVENWTKMELPSEAWEMMWDSQTKIDYGQELMELLDISFLDSESIDGVECYVFDIGLNMTEVADYILQLMPEMGEIGIEPEMLTNLLQKMSISQTEWIAKDTNLMLKADAQVLMEITPEDVGATAEDFEKITMDINIEVTIHDYNQPVSVMLPPEALNATEIEIPMM